MTASVPFKTVWRWNLCRLKPEARNLLKNLASDRIYIIGYRDFLYSLKYYV
ncbi:MAG: hypothetical protein ACFFAO_07070 [Candidatus Hermodarchaeota archaeon]